jgi:hypothetical protein
MHLKLIQGGLAHAASTPPPEPRLSGEFVRRPDRPPPPQELDSSFGKVTLAVVCATLLFFVALL